MKKWINLALFFALSIAFIGCDDDDNPTIPNEEEVITTVIYSLVPEGGGEEVLFTFRDMDGDGAGEPVITGGTLQSGTVYNGTLTFLNETETPAEDVTEEIRNEDEEHQVFFSSPGDIVVSYSDKDENENPIGLATKLDAGTTTGTTTLKIVLIHEPDKAADGVSEGDPTNAGGETDIDVSFTVEIE